MTQGVSVSLLGPLEVSLGGRAIALPGRKQRELAAALALNANQVVAVPSIVDALWGEAAPDRAEHTLQQHVSSLRKLLDGSAEPLLVTRSPGYLLRVSDLDVDAFEQAAANGFAAAEAGNWVEARTAFQHALERWRGPALANVRDSDRLSAAATRLDELRLTVLEASLEARLECGDTRSVIPDLEHVVAEYPLRERLRGLLMLALYRSGRQADALTAYQEARRVLVDELGIEPGPELRELEQAILLQRSDLGARTTGSMRELHATFRADARTSAGRVELPDGQAVLLMSGVTAIGRDADSVVRLVDNRVSRHHAEIHVDDTTATVRDLGSTNGTSVNGKALLEDHVLRDGDVLSVGGVELRFRVHASSH